MNENELALDRTWGWRETSFDVDPTFLAELGREEPSRRQRLEAMRADLGTHPEDMEPF
jgi:hypothetical protein